MTIREQLEERERKNLSPYATLSCSTKGRMRDEPQCDIRPVFQRDRDRILHCKAFRRLKQKTQVFLLPSGDHYRTRLTHTLEVSQNARTIARALRLNEDLVEAIALGHDLGHTPFGHAGERALNTVYHFSHNKQSLRVVDCIEKEGRGLNLTWEVRDGILNHQTAGHPHTLEGQVLRISDKLAYIYHDMDDAIRGGILTEEDIPADIRNILGSSCKERLNKLIHDVIINSMDRPQICMSPTVEKAMSDLRRFMFENVYLNPKAKGEEDKAVHMIEQLFEYYMKWPEALPQQFRNALEKTEIYIIGYSLWRRNMYYPDELIEEIRTRNDIVDVISGYVRLQKKGSSYFGLCPFHNEKSPSFSVSRQKQMYYCFGCGAGGNVFTFLMEYENFSFMEAVKFLADRAGIRLPEMEYSKEAKEKADLKASILEVNKKAAKYYYVQLRSERGQKAYTYLKDRGLSDDTIKAFGLGYSNVFSDDLYKFLRQEGYSEDLIRQAGLINTDEKKGVYDKFWNRVIFPIMDVNSRVIGFGGRVMGDAKPKYLNSPETPVFDKSRNLYGLNRARTSKKPYFLLCEGYMDVISLHQAGFTNAVASLGTALTAGHASLIKRYVKEVYLTYDSDDAGTRAALRAVPILREAGISARVVRMDPYKDPDEFIKNLGAEEYEKRIQNARNGFMFSLEMLERDYDMASPEGKTEFFREAARRLLAFEDELERNNYIEAVASAYKVSRESLEKLVAKTAVSSGLARPAARPKRAEGTANDKRKEDGILTSQKALLTWMIEDEKLFSRISSYIHPDDFSDGIYRKVAELLYEQHKNGSVTPASILNHFTEEEEHREAASLFNTKIRQLKTKEEEEQALKEIILRVKSHSIDERTHRLDPTDMAGLQRLMEEKRKLEGLRTLHISID